MPVKKVTVSRVSVRDNGPQIGWCMRVTFSDRKNIYIDVGDKAKMEALGAAIYAAIGRPRAATKENENV